MSPMDPRLNTLRTRARMWDLSLDWLEEPDEISLEIIPPTDWPEARSAAAAPGRTSARKRDVATECRALAILAAALITAVQGR
jgi:hypothetical protein